MKVRNAKGFTLVELLAATVILVLTCVAVAALLPVSLRAYREITLKNESQVLYSSLQTAITGELDTAASIKTGTDAAALTSYTSKNFGAGANLTSKNKQIQVTVSGIDYDLVSSSTYTSGLTATLAPVQYDSINQRFTVTLTVSDSDGKSMKSGTFYVRPLNP